MHKWLERIREHSSDDIVVGLLAQCVWMPPYYAAVPCFFVLWRIAKDHALRRRIWETPFFKALIGFSLIMAVQSLLWGDLLSKSFGCAFAIGMLTMVYLRVVATPRTINFMLRSVLWGTFANLAFALSQILRYDWAGGYRPDSWFFNANVYSMVSGFILVCALYQWIRRLAPKPLLVAAMVSCLAGLLLSGSRTGMASALFGSFVLILSLKSKKGTAIVLASGAALVVALSLLFPEWLRLNDPNSTLGVRTSLWKVAVYCIKKRPIFGYGGWTFGDVYPKYGFMLRGEVHTHNLFLEILLSVGIVGAALLLVYAYGHIRDIFRLHKRGGGRGYLPLALAVCCMSLFHGMMDMTLFSPPDAMMLFFALSVAGWLRFPKGALEAEENQPGSTADKV